MPLKYKKALRLALGWLPLVMLGQLGVGVLIGSRVLGDPSRSGAQLAEAHGRPGHQLSPGWWGVVRSPLIGGQLDRLDRQGMADWVTGRASKGL